MKRVSILAVLYAKDKLPAYTAYIISELKKCSEVIAVTAAGCSEAVCACLEEIADKVIVSSEKNAAALYKKGAEFLINGRKGFAKKTDRLIFVSDSFFGPFYGFDSILSDAQTKLQGTDVWTLTGCTPDENRKIHGNHQLHTFFTVMNKKVLSSKSFSDFWKNECKTSDEIEFFYSLDSFLGREGFKSGCLYDLGDDGIQAMKYDSCRLISEGLPFLCREAVISGFGDTISVRFGSDLRDSISLISEKCGYNTDMILEYAIGEREPFEVLSAMGNHFVVSGRSFQSDNTFRKDAVMVFHAHYDELFDENLTRLEKVAGVCDVIITATSAEKCEIIGRKIKSLKNLSKGNTRIILSEGRGRDMGGLLIEARQYLSEYKYIGFSHDKKSVHHQRLSAEAFKDIIIDNVIPAAGFVREVLSLFDSDNRLGLLVPPVPEHEKYFAVTGRSWCENYVQFKELCGKLGIPVAAEPDWTCFALGTAFWCRYDALKDLFEFDWQRTDFPCEPLALNGTISHAIERCFPFIARRNGFMSGVIYNENMAARYLNMQGYMISGFMPVIHSRISMERQTFNSYCQMVGSMETVKKNTWCDRSRLNYEKKLQLIERSKYFDKDWYIEKYPEAKESGLSAAEYFHLYGWRQGNDPSEKFSVREYLAINKDVALAEVDPLWHYEKNGKFEGRKITYDTGNYKALSIPRGLTRWLGKLFCKELIRKNSNARILVVLHLFYMVSWKEIKQYLKNLDAYKYDLVVTYTNAVVDEAVLEDIRKYKPDAVMKECSNLGYDVGSFTEVLSDTELSDYDIIFKLQSKGVNRPKIYIYGEYLKKRDWFLNLFEGCLGAFTVHRTIDRLMNDDSAGLVAAKNLIVKDPSHKQNMVKEFMRERGISIPDKYLFVAGTCFAVRSELMQPIKDMGLMVSDYKPAGAEFSLAHKMERIICLTVLNQGYKFYGNKVLTLRRTFRKFSIDYYLKKKHSAIRLLEDKRFELDDEFVYFCLEQRLVKKYELVDIPLKDIRRLWEGKAIPLKECHPYKYLVQGDSRIYEKYCRLNRRDFNLDIMSENRFDELIDSIEQNGFDSHSAVVVNGDNILMDGQHRCCYMLYKYGEDYKLPCVRIYELFSVSISLKDWLRKHLPTKYFELLKSIYHKFF